jgi:phosphatidylserine decarboxylase
MRYTLAELLTDPAAAARYDGGTFVTLRLTSTMYHRFHAPGDCQLNEVTYVAGETWNVNPAALARIDRLYCRNERAVVRATLRDSGEPISLVAVASILVASIHLNFVDVPLTLRYQGPSRIQCHGSYRKGQELGYFHHGSTIIVLASSRLALVDSVREGALIRMGEPLLRQG